MRRIRQLAPVLLAAIFWIAQVQGTVHGISHLTGSADASDHVSAPHGVLCAECAAFAQAGAAPILALPAAGPVVAADGVIEMASAVSVSAAPAHAYRSRAPPRSPI
jgi:hypothetical protein